MLHVRAAEWKFFHTDEVQVGLGVEGLLLFLAAPAVGGAEKVQPGAETGFRNSEVVKLIAAPALFEGVILQKHVTGFLFATVAGEIHIAELVGDRRAVLPLNTGTLDNTGTGCRLLHQDVRTLIRALWVILCAIIT